MNRKNRCLPVITALIIMASLVAFPAIPASAAERPRITVGRLNTPPTIDGVFNASEWGAKSFTVANAQPNVQVKKEIDSSTNQEKPIETATSDVYMGYDDTHFYLCYVSTYNTHKNTAVLGSMMWKEDCLQTKISATINGPVYNDMDFGVNAENNRAMAKVWNGNGVSAPDMKAGKNNDFMVVRSGSTTVYEIAYPLTSFATSVLKLQKGREMAFSLAQHMSGGGFYEFAGGIVDSKNIAEAAIIVLGDPKDLGGTVNTPAPNPGQSTTQSRATTTGKANSGNTTTTKQGGNPANSTTMQTNDGSGGTDESGSTETGGTEETQDSFATNDATTGTVAENAGETEGTTPLSNKNSGPPIGLIVGIIAAVVVLGGGAALYFLVIRKRLNKGI